jgi:ribosomal protein L1
LPKGKANIKNIVIKLTMGKPVKVEVKKWRKKRKLH